MHAQCISNRIQAASLFGFHNRLERTQETRVWWSDKNPDWVGRRVFVGGHVGDAFDYNCTLTAPEDLFAQGRRALVTVVKRGVKTCCSKSDPGISTKYK